MTSQNDTLMHIKLEARRLWILMVMVVMLMIV